MFYFNALVDRNETIRRLFYWIDCKWIVRDRTCFILIPILTETKQTAFGNLPKTKRSYIQCNTDRRKKTNLVWRTKYLLG